MAYFAICIYECMGARASECVYETAGFPTDRKMTKTVLFCISYSNYLTLDLRSEGYFIYIFFSAHVTDNLRPQLNLLKSIQKCQKMTKECQRNIEKIK